MKTSKTLASVNAFMSNSILLIIFLCLILSGVFISCSKKSDDIQISVISSDQPNSLQTIIDDMTFINEDYPHGVPAGYDWYSRGVVHSKLPPAGFFYMSNWGQFYETKSGNKSTNSRVQMRNVNSFYLSKTDGLWHQLQIGEKIDGAWFNELQEPKSKTHSDMITDSQGINATAGNGYCYHYWSKERGSIVPVDILGIYTTCEARLIIGDLALPDDRVNARYVLNMGADYWQNQYTGDNESIGMGRFKYVKTGWRSFNFTTLAENDLRANPPPL